MKLEEAIEILTLLEKTLAPSMTADGTDAVKLGIEALKHLQYERDRRIGFWTDLIPGETEE